jgi:predicted HNH restriction endonuclease
LANRKNYYLAHRDEELRKRRALYYSNHESELERLRRYKRSNPDKIREDSQKYRIEHQEEVRDYNTEYQRKHPEVRIARNKARILPQGIVCQICGTMKDLQKHHPDYSKPLEVVILCRSCHEKLHRRK